MSLTARTPALPAWRGEVLAFLLPGGWIGLHAGDLILSWRADGPRVALENTPVGPLEVMALLLATGLLWRGAAKAGGRFTPWAALAFAAGMLVPSTLLAAMLLIGLGAVAAWEGRGAARWGAIGMAGLGANLLWVRLGQEAVGGPLIDAEAWTTAALLSLAEPGLLRDGHLLRMPSGHGVVILPGCSLGQTLPVALLCFLLVWHRDGARPDGARLWPAMAGLVLALAANNQVRLGLLAWSPAGYGWGHGFLGANMFGLVALLLIHAFAEPRRADG